MKVERWEGESDVDWSERLLEETEIANDIENTQYFVKEHPENEEEFIINYVGKDSWTWKEHPEGPFSCKQVLYWKSKAEKLDRLLPSLQVIAEHADPLIDILLREEQS